MIYFACRGLTTYALYDGVLISIPEYDRETRVFLTGVFTSASIMTRDEKYFAHHFPECRALNWSLKIRYTERNWNAIEQCGTTINRLAHDLSLL